MPTSERFRPYVAVYLVYGQVLLLRRYNTDYQEGNYGLVSGHLEGGETTKQGIIREAKEEANIDLNSADLEVVHVMHQFSPAREYFDIYLKAEKWSGEIAIMEPDKCDDLKWFKLNSLPGNMIPEVRFALDNIQAGEHYGEIGWAV